MSDMGPSLTDLAKSAGLAVATSAGALSKQTLVDARVQFLCTDREDTAADAFLAALQAKRPQQPAAAAEDFCRAELQKLKATQGRR